MSTSPSQPSTQRLGEFLVFLSLAPDEATAVRVAVERAASALEAEVAVLLGPTGVVGSVGFALGNVPVDELTAVVADRRRQLPVPGAGACHVAVAALSRAGGGHLVVARSGVDGFTADEVGLLRGMARALELTLETLRTTAAERRQAAENSRLLAQVQRRQRLLEQISTIQRAITSRSPQQEVLDSITVGAHRLLGGEDVVVLWMRDPDNPDQLLLVSSRGLGDDAASRLWRVPVAEAGGPGQALLRDELVVAGPAKGGGVSALLGDDGIVASMAAPVHEAGRAVGSLEVASRRRWQGYTRGDQAVLRVFAEQVSLTVTDARTHEAMVLAFHDPLTGLASRRLFTDRLEHALLVAARTGTRTAVLFIDLDRFKNVNDALGHAAGDSLLAGVADRVRGCVRDGDLVARLGGDEFAVVLMDLHDARPAVAVAERIIAAVRAPFVLAGKEVYVDASVGVAIDAEGHTTGELLLSNADLAMYEAKRVGRGRVATFEPRMREAFARELELEEDLRHAQDRHELLLHYQPLVDLATGAVTAVEALLRWQHPRHGLVHPAEFIATAEETGLVVGIGQWVFGTACQQVAEWNRSLGAAQLTLHVNLSVCQVRDPALVDQVAEVLATTGLDPQHLVLEITESLFPREPRDSGPAAPAGGDAEVRDRLRQLDRLGVRLAIDDFGTGSASMAYLRDAPIHMLKIDRSFVAQAATDPDACRLVLAMVQFGHALDLVAVAEGIEADDQAAALRDTGCDLGQGHFFAAPQPAAALGAQLLARQVPSGRWLVPGAAVRSGGRGVGALSNHR